MRRAFDRSEAGFTLLEAIVALVIFSTAGLALFSWINQNLSALARTAEVSAQAQAKRNILEYMNEINPMERATGSNDFGTYQIAWKSAEEIAPHVNAAYPVGTGAFLVGLYRDTIEVTRPNGTPWFAFELRMVGFRRIFLPANSASQGG
jgi:general secretion pathway protein I